MRAQLVMARVLPRLVTGGIVFQKHDHAHSIIPSVLDSSVRRNACIVDYSQAIYYTAPA